MLVIQDECNGSDETMFSNETSIGTKKTKELKSVVSGIKTNLTSVVLRILTLVKLFS